MPAKKIVSVVVPIFNEVQMVDEIYSRVSAVFDKIDNYNYELVFFDDGSTDGTKEAIKKLCNKHNEVKSVFYARNFGYLKSTFYCMQQAKGDCAVILHADLQNPPEVIPELIEKWESGSQVVLGIKNKSHENKLMYTLRTIGYFILINFFGIKMVPHATEFELFDKSFINILKSIKTTNPFLRGIVSEYAANIEHVYFTQDARKKGKSKFNFSKYYDFAMCGITQYGKKTAKSVISLSLTGIILSVAEFFFVFIPQCFEKQLFEISNSFLTRFLIFLIFILFILLSVSIEFLSTAITNLSEKPFIIEEERINY